MFNVLFLLAGKVSVALYDDHNHLHAGLVRIFVYGEPCMVKGEAWSKYWTHRKQADRDLACGKSKEAAHHLVKAAQCLGRPPPVSFIDCMSSLFWQMLCIILDKMKLPKLVRVLMNAEKRYQGSETISVASKELYSSVKVASCAGRPLRPTTGCTR